ncbi:protein of unknown function [Taphrina deformans PYCC 5710]|uniref:L-2-hydroxyglutarate dehydrogenase, mitochondrial n=1 Tax=Taphrina deformans (strain PYCC 5710 / ATCC 11124 / CBS 356.35 / IMI 108563 / JCM 9778 / NBRC 8474) TaxID=1097556 RepID=R4XD88_TAPDE|nr:protein of unknown function [Taphrina deformans PYCC 5710]|eukprot:CCG83846.1 protein of unknown function [Taphrina deformans PYCC 5710]
MALDFSHVVVGGGAIGLAVAARLAAPTGPAVSRTVLLLERNRTLGSETSSRNSEVIHAGLYYPPDSLKTHLCLKGKAMLYGLLERRGIGYRRCGKWIVAQDGGQEEYLGTLKAKADALGVPTEFVSSARASRVEPHIRVDACALESTTTGIMDSHGLMAYLRAQFENDGGDVSPATRVEAIEKISGGYRITTRTEGGEEFQVTTESVINSAGLSAVNVANMVLPEGEKVKGYYAKGQYYAYSGRPAPSRLIYPCPEKDLAGLGTHLTFDLAGQLRFGPDVEWTDDPTDYSTSSERIEDVFHAVKQFYPSLDRSKLTVDYCGIRPKMTPAGASASDFMIREESSRGLPGFVNLLGMESPGLTSCLAIADHVEELLK